MNSDLVLDLRGYDESHAIFELSARMLFPYPTKRNDDEYFRDWVMRIIIGLAATQELEEKNEDPMRLGEWMMGVTKTYEPGGDQARLGEWIGTIFKHYEISWGDVARNLFIKTSKRPLPREASRARKQQGLQTGYILKHAMKVGIQGACEALADNPDWQIKGRNVGAKNKKIGAKAIRKVFDDFRPVAHLWTAFIASANTMQGTSGGLLRLERFNPGGLQEFIRLSMMVLEKASTITQKTGPKITLLSPPKCWKILI